jgi:hypothetical protein
MVFMRVISTAWARGAVVFAVAAGLSSGIACSDDDDGAGDGGQSGSGALSGAAGSSGGTGGGGGAGGSGGAGTGGTGGAATGGSGGSSTADGGQPLGALCVNDSNCNQASGTAVCCVVEGCPAPCECALTTQCPEGTLFLPCNATADCNQFGGGKICCEMGSGANVMRFCTKQNGCAGTILP